MSQEKRIPQHVAIIMDGNGRWAELHGLQRHEGHAAGIEPIRASLRAAIRYGIGYLTFYAFSTENWGRPAQEVDALMELFCQCVIHETPELQRQGIRLRTIGDNTRFSEKVRSHLARAEEQTAAGDRLTFILALNYSSRDEITRATRQIAARAAAGALDPERIDEATLSGARHGGVSRSRPGDPHQRREAVEQLPALAGILCRTLLPPGAVARLLRRGVRPCDSRIRPARPAVRTGQMNES